jgi:prepilin-type N-terminal cleavage/methylation domain-containing protein
MRRGAGRGGYTLAELIAVIAILAVLGTISVGVFAALPARFAHEQAAGAVRALLRRARAAALEARADARVVFEKGRAEAQAWKPLGLWRFEDLSPDPADPRLSRTSGARGMDARVSGATQDDGALGKALDFEEPGAFADCGNAPIFSPRDGVRVQAYVFPADFAKLRADPKAKGRPPPPPDAAAPPARPGAAAGPAPWVFQVAGKGGEYWLRVREDYAVLARVSGERGLYVARETPPGALTPERWTEVAFVYDGASLQIFVDGLRRDIDPPTEDPMPKRLTASAAPLLISSPEPGLSWLGGLDEVAVAGMVAEEETRIPDDVAVDAPPAVRFDGQGELDPLYHEGAVAIRFRLGRGAAGAGSEAAIVVERSGVVR